VFSFGIPLRFLHRGGLVLLIIGSVNIGSSSQAKSNIVRPIVDEVRFEKLFLKAPLNRVTRAFLFFK
jgi:hypothetical protein